MSLKAQDIVAEPNVQLFTVLAAINAAGYDEAANKPEQAPLRAAVRRDLAAKNIPSLAALKELYQRKRLFEAGRDLSQYVSLALFLGPPPSFELQGNATNLPPEVGDLEEMVPLIVAFYKEAGIDKLWEKYQPAMELESDRYRKFMSREIVETNAYLRMDTSGYFNRKFAIYISPLGAPNQTNARSYGDNYYVVVSPSAELPVEEIRHGWLHYLLDPYPYKFSRTIDAKSELMKIADRVPGFDNSFRNSFSLVLTESLIRAIQTRRSGASQDAKKHAVDESVQQGYFLTAYFYEAMQAFEKQPVGMRLYYEDMIDAIDVKKEEKRVAKVDFHAAPAVENHETLWTSVEQLVRQGEDHIARGQYEEARQVFEALSKQYGPQPRALYDLAIVATQQKQPQTAKDYFTQAANLSSDPHIKAWSHIYLGRLLDVEGSRDEAKTEYTAALAAGDPAAETRAAAEKGLKEGFTPAGKASAEKNAAQPEEKPRQGVPLGKEE